MDFGMPTLLETETLADCADLCCELGLSFIELNMNFPQYQLHRMDADALRGLGRERSLYFTIHLEENLNIADFNPRVTDAYCRTVTEAIALAKAIEAPVINMHLAKGIAVTLPHRRVYLFQAYRREYLERITAFRRLCRREIGDAPLRICIENTDGFPPHEQEAVELLLESPCFALTFDVGHSHAAGDVDEAFYRRRRDRLIHMHLHDARGASNHLALGDGEIDLHGRLNWARERDCRVVLETKTVAALRRSAPQAKELAASAGEEAGL